MTHETKISNDTDMDGHTGNGHEETIVQICASKDFAYGSAINRLTTVQLPSLAAEQISSTKPWSSFYGPRPADESSDGSQDQEILNQMVQGEEDDPDERARRQILSSLGCFISLDAVLAVSPNSCT